ncbi:AUGMIN subunit 6 [Camellia lanceoleosa]|uniref:AUGMIN subunit 6 n=1 Tax=Camellia lanceoleosa TaxID=1840588 RepID=A0ACC0F898_9ERIC|nr:AUGMIN subunit 6 [Camellia lanceoleosa]
MLSLKRTYVHIFFSACGENWLDLTFSSFDRRRFLKNAETAIQRQAMWSNLAHEKTAEFRGLCAEEAYLQQELEKLYDLRNKVKLDGELWDELVSSSSQNSHLVQRATCIWDSLLAQKRKYDAIIVDSSEPVVELANEASDGNANQERLGRISQLAEIEYLQPSLIYGNANR